MSDETTTGGGETRPPWYRPWQWPERHWWWWWSAVLVGVGLPLGGCLLTFVIHPVAAVAVVVLLGVLVHIDVRRNP